MMATTMNQSLFEDNEEQDQSMITQMSFVPFPTTTTTTTTNLSTFHPLGAITTTTSSSSSLSLSTPNWIETLLAAATVQKPPQDLLASTYAPAGEQLFCSVNRSSANSWAWGGATDLLMGGKRSGGGDHGHKYLGIPSMKMKKILLKGRRKVREPRFCFKTMSDVDVLDDGYKWRKYGQKVVKNTQHPRSYYRCTQENCRVKKRVERLAEDPRMVITTYEGRHVHSPSNDLEDSQTPHSQLNDFLW